MKTVRMFRDHNIQMSALATRAYRAGKTYGGVLEEHARQIVAAGAGEIVAAGSGEQGGQDGTARQSRTRRKT